MVMLKMSSPELGLEHTQPCISTIPDFKTNIFLVQKYREFNPTGIIIVIASTGDEARELYAEGATYVIMPKYLSARYASSMIMRLGFSTRKFEAEKAKHMDTY
jgi:Trk K+ transport system NAD-binding subunit